MPLIKNPQHSRPIDVHRWSDHPEVKQLVEEVWEDWLPEAFTEKEARGAGARPGPKAKASDDVRAGRKLAIRCTRTS